MTKLSELKQAATENILGVKIVNADVLVDLVVRECVNLCSNLRTTYAGGTDMSPEEIAKDTAESLAEIIKEHFGLTDGH